jgi:Ras-related protein M-Ras
MSGTSYRMVLLGDGEVGKSSLISQFTHKKFDSYYDPTIDEIFEHWIEIDGEWRELELFDTAGNEEFSVMKDHFIRKGIVLYNVIFFFEIFRVES